MRILLLGSTGLLGKNIMRRFSKCQDVLIFGAARKKADFNLDLTDDENLEYCFQAVNPDVVINAAAIVGLMQCEKNVQRAYQINTRMVSKLTELCACRDSYLIQISTDHYYSCDGNKKHGEADPVRLVNEYAKTKYLGECLANLYENSLIIRTNIVGLKGEPSNPTFLEWVIRCIEANKQMVLFNDFYTSSIHAHQLAGILFDLLRIRPKGILNVASSTVKSKKEFIESFVKNAYDIPFNFMVGSVKSMQGIRRAESLGLNVDKAERLLGYSLPTFDEVIKCAVREFRGEVNEI